MHISGGVLAASGMQGVPFAKDDRDVRSHAIERHVCAFRKRKACGPVRYCLSRCNALIRLPDHADRSAVRLVLPRVRIVTRAGQCSEVSRSLPGRWPKLFFGEVGLMPVMLVQAVPRIQTSLGKLAG